MNLVTQIPTAGTAVGELVLLAPISAAGTLDRHKKGAAVATHLVFLSNFLSAVFAEEVTHQFP